MKSKEKIRVAVIGGGTGTVPVLMGLKKHKDVELSVIVNMTDDGGSNKVVRDEFGLLPLSDLRKSIIALANAGNGIFRQLFTYRFDKGEGLSGHTLGNLMMMALSDITGSEEEAVRAASAIFSCRGEVIPVTYNDVRLVADFDDGKTIHGEHLIDEPEEPSDAKITRFYFDGKAHVNPKAKRAIEQADFIVAGPGDLYTSTLASIIVDGVPQAIQKSKGTFIFINNLMTKKGQTHWMKATDLVDEVSKYSGRTPDVVVMNTGKIPPATLRKYSRQHEYLVKDDLPKDADYKIIRTDVVSNDELNADKGDTLVRSLIRHDSEELADVLYNLFLKKHSKSCKQSYS
ncbi:MAG: uridine diphosphate-N-acetylglucosamine-binding protein YvcK [Candidatus Dojkabacteria bacterium]